MVKNVFILDRTVRFHQWPAAWNAPVVDNDLPQDVGVKRWEDQDEPVVRVIRKDVYRRVQTLLRGVETISHDHILISTVFVYNATRTKASPSHRRL